jgi:hypothetical protein
VVGSKVARRLPLGGTAGDSGGGEVDTVGGGGFWGACWVAAVVFGVRRSARGTVGPFWVRDPLFTVIARKFGIGGATRGAAGVAIKRGSCWCWWLTTIADGTLLITGYGGASRWRSLWRGWPGPWCWGECSVGRCPS